MDELERLKKRLEELKKEREKLLSEKQPEYTEETDYKEFMKKCLKAKGGGIAGMQLCAREWKQLKGEDIETEAEVKPEDIGKFIIIGHKMCSGCEFLKDVFKDEIERGEIKYVDIESKEGKEYDEMFDIKEFPFIVYREKDVYKKCDIKVEGDNITIETVD